MSTSNALEFHTTFQSLKSGLIDLLEEPDPDISKASALLAELRSSLAKTRGSLPSYDQRSYDLQLKGVESRLGNLRARDKPKSRFAFKPSSSSPVPPVIPEDTKRVETLSSVPSTSHSLSNHSHTYLSTSDLSLCTDSTFTYTLTLSNLKSCIIDLRPSLHAEERGGILTALHAKGLERCLIIGPIVGGSVMISELVNCWIVIGAHQFRMHSSSGSTVLLHVDSIPVIEHCTDLRIGSYPLHEGSKSQSHHEEMQDFDWVRGGPSPNWELVSEADHTLDEGTLALLNTDKPDIELILSRLVGPSVQHA